MPDGARLDVARRYVAWLRRRSTLVFAVAALVVAASGYLILRHLPLYADFAALLPPDAPAVRDLRRLEARVQDKDTALVLVAAPDPETRAAAAALTAEKLRALPPALVTRVEDDDAIFRDFGRAHSFLHASVADLETARRLLRERIERAKLEANPLFIDLDDDEEAAAAAAASQKELDELRAKFEDGRARADRSGHVGDEGRLHLLVVRTAFEKTDAGSGKRLLAALEAVRDEVRRVHPTVTIGLTGGVVTTVAEHTALAEGIIVSSIVTGLLVAIVLFLFFRSAALLAVLTAALLVCTLAAFGVAALTVGHLNAATAFLGAIIAGNGVNYGILLLARYLEERRARDTDEAMAVAVHGTLLPTLVASLGAAIAYGSLAATSFRGFADFAVIGAVGMMLCWIGSFTLLPALVLRFAPSPRVKEGHPIIGRFLARVFGFRHPVRVLAGTAVVAALAGWITYRYIEQDPFEYDITRLRSEGDDAVEARTWMARSDAAFGRGISGETYIAVDSLAEVDQVLGALARVDRPGAPPTVGRARSIRDLVPADQERKLALLSEIRTLLDDDALEALDDEARDELRSLRPPDDLAAITLGDLPPALAERLRERDGRVGLLLAIRPALTLNEWDGRDLVRFADAVRRLELDDGRTITTSGASVVFADILDAVASDGPKVTLVAVVLLVIMVVGVVGPNRAAGSVLLATFVGALLLIAVCALLGLKVNFLDFIALPITLGLGVDYGINLAHRQRGEAHDPLQALRSSGAAVVLCSLTTIIGYGSLLVSENLAIRGFGTAALIGEITCLVSALVIVPAVVSSGRRVPPAAV